MANVTGQVVCPHCSEGFDLTLRDRRGKGGRKNVVWLPCPKCGQPVEIVIKFTETEFQLSASKGR